MVRGLIATAAALSVMIFVAIAVLWVRGFRRVDSVTLFTRDHVTCLVAGESHMALVRLTMDWASAMQDTERPVGSPEPSTRLRFDYDSRPADDPYDWTGWAEGPDSNHHVGPFGILIGGHPPEFNSESQPDPLGWKAFAPDWALAGASLALPGFLGVRALRRRWRRRLGLCRTCNYDLRASSCRCPECGTVIDPHGT